MQLSSFPQITIRGAARERGRQYGQQTADQVRHSIASYSRLFAVRRGLDWLAVQERALTYVPVLEAHAAELLEEMRGIAEGAGRGFAEIVALNVRTELLAGAPAGVVHPRAGEATKRNRAADVPDHGECTTLAALPEATAAGGTLLAQTWDWTGDQRGACVVLRVEAPGRPALLTITEAGILAKIGLNEAGLGVTLNILQSEGDGETPGMAVHVLLRRVLEARSLDEAVGMAQAARAGASSCVTVASADGRAASLEITPHGVGLVQPRAGLLVHTNHCLDDATRASQCALPALSSSEPRLNRSRVLLEAARGSISRDTLVAALRDHEGGPMCICRHPDPALPPTDRVESVLGVVMDLPARTLDLAPGVPCQVAFERLGVKG